MIALEFKRALKIIAVSAVRRGSMEGKSHYYVSSLIFCLGEALFLRFKVFHHLGLLRGTTIAVKLARL